MFEKTEYFQGFYYVNKHGEPTIKMTDGVHWLEGIKTTGFRYKTRERKAFDYFQKEYPEIKEFIKLS